MRKVLCIRPHDVGYRGRIVALHGHYYTVRRDDGTLVSDFRTHRKYAKRLYYGLLPVWRLCHAWDRWVANPLIPAWNVGFDTLTAYPDPNPETTTVDGQVVRLSVDETWGTLRGGAGNFSDDSSADQQAVRLESSATSNQFGNLTRWIGLFDTSPLTSNAVPSAATVSIWCTGKADNLGAAPATNVYSANPASNTALANADYGALGTTAYCDTNLAYSAWTTSAYNDMVLNATGIAAVAVSGVTKYGLRDALYDVANVAPTWSSVQNTTINVNTADQTGTANDPKLVITYSRPLRSNVDRLWLWKTQTGTSTSGS